MAKQAWRRQTTSLIPPEAQVIFAAIAALPTLPRGEQDQLLHEYARTRCPKLEARLVGANLRFVTFTILRDWRAICPRLPLADLVQEGSLGLLHALRKFEPERGLAFSTYAVWWVRARIRCAIKGSLSPVKIDRNRMQLGAIEHAVSIEDPAVEELLPPALPPNEEEIDQSLRAARYEAVAAEKLSVRERTVLHFRARGMTLQELGDQLKLSRERVRQIEKRAMATVKKELAA